MKKCKITVAKYLLEIFKNNNIYSKKIKICITFIYNNETNIRLIIILFKKRN